MTNKQRILQMVKRWPDDISYEKAIYHMSVLQAIDEGLKDIEAGRTRDFDEVFDELELAAMRKKAKLRMSDRAEGDLDRLQRKIAALGVPRTAKSFVSRLRKYARSLCDSPEFSASSEN